MLSDSSSKENFDYGLSWHRFLIQCHPHRYMGLVISDGELYLYLIVLLLNEITCSFPSRRTGNKTLSHFWAHLLGLYKILHCLNIHYIEYKGPTYWFSGQFDRILTQRLRFDSRHFLLENCSGLVCCELGLMGTSAYLFDWKIEDLLNGRVVSISE